MTRCGVFRNIGLLDFRVHKECPLGILPLAPVVGRGCRSSQRLPPCIVWCTQDRGIEAQQGPVQTRHQIMVAAASKVVQFIEPQRIVVDSAVCKVTHAYSSPGLPDGRHSDRTQTSKKMQHCGTLTT
jgi:hypothetical protein